MNTSVITLCMDDVPNDVRVWKFKDRIQMLEAYKRAWEAIKQYCNETGAELE